MLNDPRKGIVMSKFTLADLEKWVHERAKASAAESYTRALLDKGVAQCAKKLGEEAIETVLAALQDDKGKLIAEAADLLYHLLVVLEAPAGVDTEEREMLTRLPGQVSRVLAFIKVDLVPGAAAGRRPQAPNEVWVSAKTGAGLEELRQMLLEAAGWSAGDEPVFLARERHLRALGFARRHLDEASRQLDQWEFFAEELRLAQAALAAITGEFTADDLLGEIFARFCIGK